MLTSSPEDPQDHRTGTDVEIELVVAISFIKDIYTPKKSPSLSSACPAPNNYMKS